MLLQYAHDCGILFMQEIKELIDAVSFVGLFFTKSKSKSWFIVE